MHPILAPYTDTLFITTTTTLPIPLLVGAYQHACGLALGQTSDSVHLRPGGTDRCHRKDHQGRTVRYPVGHNGYDPLC